jgi:L,D-peptidoglycan transpeptidase YkuD (ErfK/YbiS/YcfS/YnhG family)
MPNRKGKLKTLRVKRRPTSAPSGILVAGGVPYPCVLGRGGIVAGKREGDGATPSGRLALRALIQRPDKGPRIPSLLPRHTTRRNDAWCDDPADRRYNRPISRPPGSAEECLWRSDGLYDVIVPLGWNDGPVVRGRGSAIFWHVWRGARAPTAGCIAVAPDVFRKLLPRLSRRAVMVIG